MFYLGSYVLSIILLAFVMKMIGYLTAGIMVLIEEKFRCTIDACWVVAPVAVLTVGAFVFQDTIRDRVGLWPSPVCFVEVY